MCNPSQHKARHQRHLFSSQVSLPAPLHCSVTVVSSVLLWSLGPAVRPSDHTVQLTSPPPPPLPLALSLRLGTFYIESLLIFPKSKLI